MTKARFFTSCFLYCSERRFSKLSVYDVTKGIDTRMVSGSYNHLLFTLPFQTNPLKLKGIAKFQRYETSPFEGSCKQRAKLYFWILFFRH